MKRSAAPGILAICLTLLLASAEGARADRILGENSREHLGPDGRTLTFKEYGFSIVLPAPDWKIHVQTGMATPMDGDFMLLIAAPDGDVRLRIIEKIYPPRLASLEAIKKLIESHPSPREKVLRSEIVKAAGLKCWEREWEGKTGDRSTHSIARTCDQKPMRKFVLETFPGVPVDRWTAEEKVLRELIASFRVLPDKLSAAQ